MAQRKKLIEVSIPLEAINAASAREKSIRHGHPSTLHLWWARRPLAACRAVLFAQLVDDPSSWPDRFTTEEAVEAERKRLHKLIGGTKEAGYKDGLVAWESSNNEVVLNAARWEIARSVAWGLGEEPPSKGDGKAIVDYLQTKAPPVYDPFCGGGSIPLEAQRLGLRAYGSDLNPVAVLISKALVEIPPKFADLPPVNPRAQSELKRGGCWNGKGAQGLAEDVLYYGKWMRDDAEKRIGHLYPKAKLPDGSEATVIAWIWARTVRSPDPAAKGAMVPLISSFMLSTKEKRKVWVEPIIDRSAQDGYRFEVKSGQLSKAEEESLKNGTKSAKAQAFKCILTGSPIERSYVQSEGKSGRLQTRLVAVVAEGLRERIYIPPTTEHEAGPDAIKRALAVETRKAFLSGAVPTRAMITGGVCSAYGLSTWGDLFTDRQVIALATMSDILEDVRDKVLFEALASGIGAEDSSLEQQGSGALAYADAIATYLAFAISRSADRGSTLCSWDSSPKMEALRNTFARQALPMTWDFAEGNPFSSSSGSLINNVEWVTEACRNAPAVGGGQIHNINAPTNRFPVRGITVATDPPYFDNIGYAELSDFFYGWLRKALSDVWLDLFRRLSTPKGEELVATIQRFGSKEAAEKAFMDGMSAALRAMHAAANDVTPFTIFYAFKQSESAQEGFASPGWASFLQAIDNSGLAVDGTWPMRTELAGRMVSKDRNALASSIVLVCRKAELDAPVIIRSEFIRMLKRELPDAIDAIRRAGVGPVDMQQSVIGPGMGVFSRYARVMEDDDSTMSVKTALALINRVWEELENELEANFDPETQAALAWFSTYGFDARPSGELITLANAKNISPNALFASAVFADLRGKAALTSRTEWSSRKIEAGDNDEVRRRKRTLAENATTTIWACVQNTAAALSAEYGGADAAASLVAQMGSKAAEARLLAERLYQIAAQKSWQQEALVYNELAQEWPRLEELAQSQARAQGVVGAEQPTLL